MDASKIVLDDVPPPSGVFVASVERAFRIIRAFDEQYSRMTLSEVAERIDLTRGTTRRFLQTLVTLGYVTSNGKYFWLSPKVLDLGFAYLSASKLPQVSASIARRVSDELAESCSVAVLDEATVVYVHRVQPRRIYSSALEVGSRLPAHASSLGQVMLANLSEAELGDLLPRIGFKAYTDRTLTTVDSLNKKLDTIRRQGYSLVNGELEVGIISLAVPIVARNGETVAAINVAALEARTSVEKMLGENLAVLHNAAREIGVALV